MKHVAIIGSQWGDEGKGKIIDYLSPQFDTIIRYSGGNNAGHTVVVNGKKHIFHLLPSAMLRSGKLCMIGSGAVLNLEILTQELDRLAKRKGKSAKLFISDKCHLILPKHITEDKRYGGKIGTTARGIGPTYTDAVARRGVRMMDLEGKKSFRPQKYLSYYKKLKQNPHVTIGNCSLLLDTLQKKGKHLLFEGAQGTLLDIVHGTYPFVTSSHPTIGGIFVGTGFRPRKLHIIGVAKAYTTRVGKGPFPTELKNKTGNFLREKGNEYGSTTGRPRRCGWLDLAVLRYSNIINGLDSWAVTKLDVLDELEEIKICTDYKIGSKTYPVFPTTATLLRVAQPIYKTLPGWKVDTTKTKLFKDLPKQAQFYLRTIEKETNVKVQFVGIGPERKQIISCKS